MRSSRPSTVMSWSVTRPRLKPNEVRPPASPSVSLTRIGQGVLQGGSLLAEPGLRDRLAADSACSATAGRPRRSAPRPRSWSSGATLRPAAALAQDDPRQPAARAHRAIATSLHAPCSCLLRRAEVDPPGRLRIASLDRIAAAGLPTVGHRRRRGRPCHPGGRTLTESSRRRVATEIRRQSRLPALDDASGTTPTASSDLDDAASGLGVERPEGAGSIRWSRPRWRQSDLEAGERRAEPRHAGQPA